MQDPIMKPIVELDTKTLQDLILEVPPRVKNPNYWVSKLLTCSVQPHRPPQHPFVILWHEVFIHKETCSEEITIVRGVQ